MFGWLDDDSWNVNLSDGGHVDNLGIYELLRRKCRLIIVGDGECDTSFEFHGLLQALRLAQIDLAVKVTMEGLDQIRRGEQQFAIGTIQYGNGLTGKLIYLKSALLGDNTLRSILSEEAYLSSPHRTDDLGFDEAGYLALYKAGHPDFPHETTLDQFFDEAQFECYRALGFQVGMNTFRASSIDTLKASLSD